MVFKCDGRCDFVRLGGQDPIIYTASLTLRTPLFSVRYARASDALLGHRCEEVYLVPRAASSLLIALEQPWKNLQWETVARKCKKVFKFASAEASIVRIWLPKEYL
jgi:hypothetical protein